MTKPLLQSALRNPKSTIAYLLFVGLLLLPSGAWPCPMPPPPSFFDFSDPNLAPPIGPAPGNGTTDGDSVDLSTGLFVHRQTDLVLPDVIPLTLTRTYRPNDTVSRAFGIGATHPYDLLLVGDAQNCPSADLILPDGSRIRYTRTQGTTCNTAVLEHTTSPTRFHKSILRVDTMTGDWVIRLSDGTVYRFKLRQGLAKLSSIQDHNGNTLRITFDATRQVTKITSPHGRWVELTQDANQRITQAKDHIGRTVDYVYDGNGRLFQVFNAEEEKTEYVYDTFHRLLTVKNPLGFIPVTNEYDTAGHITKQILLDCGFYTFAYTVSSGTITQTEVTDPRGATRRVTFNASGYTTGDTWAVSTPEEQSTTLVRQANTNLVTSVTDALMRQTTYLYDIFANVTKITRLPGHPTKQAITSFTYTPFGSFYFPPIQLKSITDPLLHTTSFTYDSRANLDFITDPLGKQTFFDANSAGQTTLIIDPLGNRTEFTYELGDLVAVQDPVGNITTRFVDTAGRVLRVTAPQGEVTRYAYDQLNRLKEVIDPLDGETRFEYDANSNLRFVFDARDGRTEYQYDNMDRLETRIDRLLVPEQYDYDCNGNLTNFTDRKGQPTATTYDPLNRPKLVTYADASTKLYTWDKGNRLTHAQASDDGSLMCGYDPLGYVETETTPRGTVTYTHDTDGRQLSVSATGQSPASYTYDNADQLQTVSLYGLLAEYDYDDAGKRTRLTLPNGVKVEYDYDAASRLTGLTYKLGTSVLGNLTYEYDKNGQRMKMGGSFARTTLPAPVSLATYDAANRVMTFDGFPVDDDENGNIISIDGDTFAWNARDQLVGIAGPGLSATFQYDGLGRRSKKTVNGQTTEYLSDGISPLQEQAVAGGPWTALTMTGPGLDEFIARGDASGTYYFLPDGLGSTVALMDGAGAIHTEYTYAPFGDTTRTGTVTTNPFQFTGRENDGTGLYHYRARYYHPVLQRFISEDPIGFAGGDVNLYGYAFNDPINLSDPLGESAIAIATFCAANPALCWGAVIGTSYAMCRAVGLCQTPSLPENSCPPSEATQATPDSYNSYAKPSRQSGKERATDKPSWVTQQPNPGESGKDFADRVLDEHYGPGKYGKGPGSEHNKIKKWADRRNK